MKSIAAVLFILVCYHVTAQDIPRKAWMGVYGKYGSWGIAVDSVAKEGTMRSFGIKQGDTVTALNNKKIQDVAGFNKLAADIRTGDKLFITYTRAGKTKTKEGKALMRPYETSALADISYDWVPYKEGKLRTITRKPKDKNNLPAILLIPGYNCGSIENFSSGYYKHLLEAWLKAGFVIVTIEKSGVGDSYNCIPCSEADLVTDIEVFNLGYKYMEALPYVDRRKLFIFGHSMGGVIAPEIAKMHQPKGVIVYATVYRPWSEFLLEMHRVQLPLDGKTYEQTETYVRAMQKIYYEFFRLKRSPAELYQNPEYKDLVVSDLDYKAGDNNMWGRHWHFWQQLDSIDLAASWTAVQCPVLSLFGGSDYIACSLLEHQLIERTVNAEHPGNCKHITIAGVDHLLVQQADWQTAHDNFNNAVYRNAHFHYGFADTTVQWLKEQVGK